MRTPTRPAKIRQNRDPTRPDPRVHPTRVQLWNTDTDTERDSGKAKDTATNTDHRHVLGHEDRHGLRHRHGHVRGRIGTRSPTLTVTNNNTTTDTPRTLTLPLTWTPKLKRPRTRTLRQTDRHDYRDTDKNMVTHMDRGTH